MAFARLRRFGAPVGILGVVAAVSLAGLGSTPRLGAVALAAGTAVSPVTITVRLDARGEGSFTLRGGLADGGRASARRAVVSRRMNATVTLSGAKGRIVLTSQQRCADGTGAWRVVKGTLAYAGMTGRGTLSGRVRCTRPFGATRTVHRGSADIPPPALARSGAWGGATVQGSVITFTVAPDGRAVADVLVTRYSYECIRSDGQRSAGFAPTVSRLPGPFPIAEDRSFSLKLTPGTLNGRFGPSGVAGTIVVAHPLPPNIQGQTSTCSATIPWTATNPPASAPRALVGTYCGFSAAGGGVCIDVTGSGREVRNLRAEAKITCGLIAKIPVSVPVAYDQPIPFGLDLSFRQSFDLTFEGMTIRATVSGTFDPSGGLVGTVSLPTLTLVRDGRQHSCRGNGGFTARLQR